ncbi:MAG: amidohydrolase family protein [Acidobacteriota bacterium]
MKKIIVPLVLILLFTIATYSQQADKKTPPPSIVFTNVSVIDATGNPLQSDMAVLITGDKIVAIGKSNKVKLPKGTQKIEAKGKFLIPGLWDMHTHLTLSKDFSLPLFIANGVTSVRDMGGDWEVLKSWKAASANGEILSPQIKTAGSIIESANFLNMLRRIGAFINKPNNPAILKGRMGVANPEQSKQAIQKLVKDGVDFIKFRTNISREAYLAMATEAKSAGLMFVGHAPTGVTLIEASDAGQKSIEHGMDALMKLTDEERQQTYERLVKNQTWVVPTWITMKSVRLIPDKDVVAVINDRENKIDARRKYLSASLLDLWDTQVKIKKFESATDWTKVMQAYQQHFRELHKAGVRMMAGTDTGSPLVYPGFSLAEELELLVSDIGLTPMEALQSATRNPAEFFGMEKTLGAIEVGKLADVVLLEANPLENIGNIKKIAGVMLGGKYLDKPALQKILNDVEVAASKDRESAIKK